MRWWFWCSHLLPPPIIKMKNKYKILTFDFLMTINVWEFIYQLIRLNLLGKTSKRFENKVSQFIKKNYEKKDQ